MNPNGQHTSIAVVLCTCNGARWITEFVRSVMAQNRRPDSLWVADDASSDQTIGLLQQALSAAGYAGELHIRRNEQRLGVSENFRTAILHCTADLIALADQDDIWLPEKLETLERSFCEDEDLLAAASDAFLQGENGQLQEKTLWKTLGFQPNDEGSAHMTTRLFAFGNTISGATIMFRAKPVQSWLQLPVPPEFIHDYWLAILSSAAGGWKLIDQPLIQYRLHSGQQVGLRGLEGFAHGGSFSSQQFCEKYAHGLSRLERTLPYLPKDQRIAEGMESAQQYLQQQLQEHKTCWLRQIPWLRRKYRLIKEWMRRGGYLRISWKDVTGI